MSLFSHRLFVLTDVSVLFVLTGVSILPQVLFVLTDGSQTINQGPTTPLDEAAQPLKNKGVEIWSIAVGKYANKEQLAQIASRPDTMLQLDDFSSLGNVIENLKTISCKGEGSGAVWSVLVVIVFAESSMCRSVL